MTRSPRTPQPELYLGSVTTGSGVDIRSPEGQKALYAALLSIALKPQSAAQMDVHAKKVGQRVPVKP